MYIDKYFIKINVNLLIQNIHNLKILFKPFSSYQIYLFLFVFYLNMNLNLNM